LGEHHEPLPVAISPAGPGRETEAASGAAARKLGATRKAAPAAGHKLSLMSRRSRGSAFFTSTCQPKYRYVHKQQLHPFCTEGNFYSKKFPGGWLLAT